MDVSGSWQPNMTSDGPGDLPDFENPPLIETVLSVQFDPIKKMRSAHFGLFWHEINDRYPKTKERSALDPVIERFPEPARRRVGLQLQALEHPPVPRFWFVSQDGKELLQVQTDRFVKNWRKTGEGDKYPRYPRIKTWFEEDFARFQAYLTREGLGAVRVNQCEVTYVNHIVAGEGFSKHEDLYRVLNVWRQPPGGYPGPAEDVVFHARFPIRDGSGTLIGRLHVDLQPAERNTDGRPMFVLNLTARGILGDSTEFFDIGRESIVRSFAGLTTPEMHEVWKRRV